MEENVVVKKQIGKKIILPILVFVGIVLLVAVAWFQYGNQYNINQHIKAGDWSSVKSMIGKQPNLNYGGVFHQYSLAQISMNSVDYVETLAQIAEVPNLDIPNTQLTAEIELDFSRHTEYSKAFIMLQSYIAT